MTQARLALGKLGEDLALRRIRALGYKILARNYRCPVGEIDLIARDGATLVFIETKTRQATSGFSAKEAVDERKRRKIAQAALVYLKECRLTEAKARFDVVAVTLTRGRPHIDVIQNAFDLDF